MEIGTHELISQVCVILQKYKITQAFWNVKCLVVRVPGYRSRGPGSISGSTRFSEKWWVWNGSTQPRECNWGVTLKKISRSGLENREYGRRDSSRWPHGTLYQHKLAPTSPTSGRRYIRSWTHAREFIFLDTADVRWAPTLRHWYPSSLWAAVQGKLP
jgi:hypothetical protein